MSLITQFMPQVITAVAIFSAIFTHFIMAKKFWQPCFIAAFISTFAAYCIILYFPVELQITVVSKDIIAKKMSYFAFGSSFVLAITIGYLMKLLPKIWTSGR